MKKLSREQMIDLVIKIMDPHHDEDIRSEWLDLLARNVPHPAVSDLIFWSHENGLGCDPSPEQIVDMAMSYKPIIL